MEFEITERAYAKLQTLGTEGGVVQVFRIGVRGGGCSGLLYRFVLEPREKADEPGEVRRLMAPNLELVVDPMSLQYVRGGRLDYVSGLEGAKFRFLNPAARTRCQCGSSFTP